jgi:hypothetical protein
MNDLYHVAYLNKTQQASLRGLLFQYLKEAFKATSVNVLMVRSYQEIDPKATGIKIGDAVWNQFKTYNGMVKKLISFDDLIEQKGKSKVFSFTPDEMQMILQAIDLYNKNDSTLLSQYQRQMLAKDMGSLEVLCREASKHQYTYDEIKFAKENK